MIYYAVSSAAEFLGVPKFFSNSVGKLAKLQKRLAKRKTKSRPWNIIKSKISKLHQLISRQHLDWQFKLAYQLFDDCQVIFLEDLEIKNLLRRCKAKCCDHGQFLPNGQLAKSGQNKSLQDAGFGQFIQVLEYIASKLGKRVIKVNPRGTSQHCWHCLNEVKKSLKDRWHSCNCGQELDRDYNSALPIKKIGLLSQQEEDITSVKTALQHLSRGEESRVILRSN